jgi:hypothetical protein
MFAITIFMVTVWLVGMSLYIPSILIDIEKD